MSHYPDSPIGGPPPGDAVFESLTANKPVFTDASIKYEYGLIMELKLTISF